MNRRHAVILLHGETAMPSHHPRVLCRGNCLGSKIPFMGPQARVERMFIFPKFRSCDHQRVKILQLAPVWETVPPPGYGGTEAVIDVLTEELVRQGHEVLLCASGDSKTSAKLHAIVPQSLRIAGLISDPVQYAALHVAFAMRCAGDFDVIHNHNGPPSDLGMAMSHTVRTPMVTTLHNQPASDTEAIWKAYKGWYNCISRQQERTLLREALPQARYAGVVYNAVDVDSFPYQEEKSDYVLFMGRMSPEKAPHLAIEAALRAGERIVLAGKISAPIEKAYFDSRVRPLLTNGGVEYVGEADAQTKRILYAGARAQLVPLLWEEPFGLVMVEAMACGTPVIAFKRGAAPEVVIDGETGFLVENVEEMTLALEHLDSIASSNCRKHVAANFSPGALAAGYLEIYEAILARKEQPLDSAVA